MVEVEGSCECPECGKILSSEASLRGHRLRAHRVSPRTGKPAKQKNPSEGVRRILEFAKTIKTICELVEQVGDELIE